MAGVAVFLSVLIVGTQHHLDQRYPEPSVAATFRYLPNDDYLKVIVLGYNQLVADLLWLKVIQVIGTNGSERADGQWCYQAVDVITTLDPKFDYAYQLGSVFLSVLADRADLAVKLLSKGVVDNPDDWHLYFLLGFDQFYYLGDFKEAADAMAKASLLPGRPDYVPLLASRLYAHAEEPDLALDFLAHMYRLTKNEQVREELLSRMKDVTVERDLKVLNQEVQRFSEQYHRFPINLTELVAAGLLTELPTEPLGGRYYIDSMSHRVKSTKYSGRLQVYGLKQRQGASP
jgi:hypothetical protein